MVERNRLEAAGRATFPAIDKAATYQFGGECLAATFYTYMTSMLAQNQATMVDAVTDTVFDNIVRGRRRRTRSESIGCLVS
jgi:hypothetical protein